MSSRHARGDRSFRAVCWNLDSRQDGLEERVRNLAEAFDGPDVVLLQEVSPGLAHLLDVEGVPGFAWCERSTGHLDASLGARRLATAVLLSERVLPAHGAPAAGQIPEQRFLERGAAAGLSEFEIRERMGWLPRNVYVDAEVDGVSIRVCSFHARPATGGRPGRPPAGYARQLFHRVCAAWVAEQSGPVIFGVDANSPRVDHPDPQRWEPALAGDATLIGPAPEHHLRDALHRWLDDHPDELARIRAERPDGPLAISYRLPGGAPRRYDHLFVTDDIGVDDIRYRPPNRDGSDHGAIVADLHFG